MEASRISLERIRQASHQIDPVFLHSPQYECESLSAVLGVSVTLKVETTNPIRSFKGRGADYLSSQRKNQSPIVCASAGNFGQAMAYACRKRNIKLIVYAATKANPLKIDRMRALGAEVILQGEDFDGSKEIARKEASRLGIDMIEDAMAIETVEGAGTIGLELVNHMKFDVILVALGNGALFNGIATVFKDASPQTKRIAVQASGAPAMAESWKSGRVVNHESIHTIADGIGVRLPIPQALADMKPLAEDVVTVSEASILEAMRLLHHHTGLVVEPSGAVGIAALIENKSRFAGQRVATIICGGNLTEEQRIKWLG